MTSMRFSENLRRLIQAKGLKLKNISDETGIPMSTLSEWTAGRDPKVSEALLRLSRYLDVSLDELIVGKPSKYRERVVCESFFEIDGQQYSMRIFEPRNDLSDK